jgi:outer membrane protein assembly factor BamB
MWCLNDHTFMQKTWFALLIGLLAVSACGAGSDWPQILGPNRDGVYHGDDLADSWPRGGPPVLWHRDVGRGWAAPVERDGKLLISHRVGDTEKLECLDALTGKPIWVADAPTAYQDDFGFDDGPRGTPTIAGDRVFTYNPEGFLRCRDFTNGKEIWSVDTKARFNQEKGFFGMACSPLVEGGAVIVNIGAKGAGVVAFDVASGKTLWQSTDDEAGYSSPIAATIGEKRYVLAFTRAGLDALDPTTGKVYFQFPFRSRSNESVNAATPQIVDDTIFLSASYETGAALFRFHENGPEKLWGDDGVLSNHYSTSVIHAGCLYGFDGRQEQGQHLRCVDLKSGKVQWSQDDFGAGTLIIADGLPTPLLVILTEKGELVEALASPEGYKELGRKQLVGFETRANAALANGLYFARGKSQLVCVDLRKASK